MILTLVLKLDLDIVKTYYHAGYEVLSSNGSKGIAPTETQADRQTDGQIRPKILPTCIRG